MPESRSDSFALPPVDEAHCVRFVTPTGLHANTVSSCWGSIIPAHWCVNARDAVGGLFTLTRARGDGYNRLSVAKALRFTDVPQLAVRRALRQPRRVGRAHHSERNAEIWWARPTLQVRVLNMLARLNHLAR